MEIPSAADTLRGSSIGRTEGVLNAVVQSFKLKLAAYFSLISLLPLAAAFWGFDALTERAETSRADSVLQVGLRSALATYGDQLSFHVSIAEWRSKSFVQRYKVTRGDVLIMECDEVRIFAAHREGGGIRAVPIPAEIRRLCE